MKRQLKGPWLASSQLSIHSLMICGQLMRYGDNNAPQVDEVPRDISTIDEALIGTKASRSMTKLQDNNHLQLTREHVLHVGLSMEEQFEAHVEPMMEEDEQSSFGQATDLEQIDAQTVSKVAVVPNNGSLWAHIDGACNIARLPLHNGERDAESPCYMNYAGCNTHRMEGLFYVSEFMRLIPLLGLDGERCWFGTRWSGLESWRWS